ncbi:tRNA (adenine(22)-N(1))-methyltransferase [Virgibacillus ihumii]|uniref:tRNA (adenine(22)-N(1))-methyltransferase n=1 Tax=Virgibacillus ihumii TaxID=2686091 RepID=UPI00157C92D5|nr:tRNA (adenine(22)-N(1))-methyltransferase TrmK [Virgibacillus ihumii]
MRSIVKLSNRLKIAASYIKDGALFADIGSDHAYLPCYVCQQDTEAKAIAGEVSEGPYNSAVASVSYHNLAERIDVRLGDGLEVLKNNEADHLVIAGMGGTLIASILENGKEKLGRTNRIITQPNVDERSVRKWFLANNYHIAHEAILEENGHVYEVIVADKGEDTNNMMGDGLEKQLLFGPFLMNTKSAFFRQKWEKQMEKRSRVISQLRKAKIPDQEKMEKISTEIKWIEEVLHDDKKQ